MNKLLENQQILALESNKKIQKLENQLEEERKLNYSFDIAKNDRQNAEVQEANFTEKPKNINQQEENETIEDNVENITVKSSHNNTLEEYRKEEGPKKGFWKRLFGN